MNAEAPEIRRELLDDFFAESDEHLTHIRQTLVLLEASVGKALADRTVVEELFRDFHSFKGISAIVGLRAAEELAHAAEDYLRELMGGSVTVSTPGIELLMQATQRLEQIASGFRAGRSGPGIDDLAEQLRSASGLFQGKSSAPEVVSPAEEGVSMPALEEAQARGAVLWKVTFVPTRGLDSRGININSVRVRLEKHGEILKATPQVEKGGTLAFQFLVAMPETPADIAEWEADGLVAELVEEQKTSASRKISPGREEHNPFITPSHVVRVDLERLDDLMRVVGEMVIKRSRFEDELNRARQTGEQIDIGVLREVNAGFGRSLRELREGVMRVRMVPVAEIFARLPFVVRDLARDTSKKARITLEGQNTEIDKYLIEQLKDPLLHLVRNSFSHGVETPEERTARGKPEEAVIALSAATSGDSVIITIRDDGHGVDRQAVMKRARETGMPVPETLDSAALLDILCAPGFSTRTDADMAAGRGVGMAVVQNTIRALGGTLALETDTGKGTKFTIRVPLTLAIAETLVVSASSHTCVVPQTFVSEIVPVDEAEIKKVNGVEVIQYREGVLPLIRLTSFFRLPSTGGGSGSILVLQSDRGSSGLLVDRVHGQREVVVRAIRDPLVQVPGVSGATELGDGRPVLILDGAAFTSGAVRPNSREEAAAPTSL